MFKGMFRYFLIGLAAVAAYGGWLWINGDLPSLNGPSETPSETPRYTEAEGYYYTNASPDLIRPELPFPDAVVGKEFSVIGEARGYWFFEASFPVILTDWDGKIIAETFASAQPDPETGEVNWMTEEFVPFKADVKVPDDYIGRATLILKNDNPSGLPENDKALEFMLNVEY